MSSLCDCIKSLAVGFSWCLLTSGYKQCQGRISKCVAEGKSDEEFSVSAREVVSQPVFVRATEIWGWAGERGWNLRNRRTYSTRAKHALVPETRSKCQEAQQVCAGSLCQKLKKLIKKEIFPLPEQQNGIVSSFPYYLENVGKLFHNTKNRKAKAFLCSCHLKNLIWVDPSRYWCMGLFLPWVLDAVLPLVDLHDFFVSPSLINPGPSGCIPPQLVVRLFTHPQCKEAALTSRFAKSCC